MSASILSNLGGWIGADALSGMTPAISVVLPIRNGARWLPALLAALVREWETNFS